MGVVQQSYLSAPCSFQLIFWHVKQRETLDCGAYRFVRAILNRLYSDPNPILVVPKLCERCSLGSRSESVVFLEFGPRRWHANGAGVLRQHDFTFSNCPAVILCSMYLKLIFKPQKRSFIRLRTLISVCWFQGQTRSKLLESMKTRWLSIELWLPRTCLSPTSKFQPSSASSGPDYNLKGSNSSQNWLHNTF